MRIGRNGLILRSRASRVGSTRTTTTSLASARLSSKKSSSTTKKSNVASTTTGSTQIGVYSNIKTSAASVKTTASKLASTDAKSIFASAAEKNDTESIVKSVKTLVRDYNSMISNMTTSGSTVNNYFKRELGAYLSQDKTGLEKIGIKVEDNGSLTIDEKTLDKASLSDLKSVFNGTNSLSSKLVAKCPSIETKAESDYNTKLYSSSGSSNYRFSYHT